jgi:hypothetical protein
MTFGNSAVICLVLLSCGCSRSPEQNSEQPAPAAAGSPVTAPADTGGLEVTPREGAGQDQIFQLRFTSDSDVSSQGLMGLLINRTMTGESACYVFGDPKAGDFMLVNDTGIGSVPLGKKQELTNKQCDLIREGTSIKKSANTIEFNAHVRFHPSFAGPKKMFGIINDAQGATAGLKLLGTWSVP